jgi:hypothetical protein
MHFEISSPYNVSYTTGSVARCLGTQLHTVATTGVGVVLVSFGCAFVRAQPPTRRVVDRLRGSIPWLRDLIGAPEAFFAEAVE